MEHDQLQARALATDVSRGEIDLGLRSYMLQVYNYMGSGLALTGLAAFSVANIPQLYNAIFGTPLAWYLARKEGRLVRFLGVAVDIPVVLPPAVDAFSFTCFSKIGSKWWGTLGPA